MISYKTALELYNKGFEMPSSSSKVLVSTDPLGELTGPILPDILLDYLINKVGKSNFRLEYKSFGWQATNWLVETFKEQFEPKVLKQKYFDTPEEAVANLWIKEKDVTRKMLKFKYEKKKKE